MIFLFLDGAAAVLALLSALFFLKFWRRSREALFVFFAAAFALLAGAQILTAFGIYPEDVWALTLRLGAFLLMIAGMAWKNFQH